jgi:hypothetical protein
MEQKTEPSLRPKFSETAQRSIPTVFVSTSSTTNRAANATFTVHSSTDHSVSSEDVPLPPMSPIMDLIPDIPQELIDIAVANL